MTAELTAWRGGSTMLLMKARMVSLEEKRCVSWDISVGLRRSGRENYGNEPA